MSNESEILNNIIYHNNQHPERTKMPSEAVYSIMHVIKCDETEALKLLRTHCNSIVTYAILLSKGKIGTSYTEFFEQGYKSGAINKYGFIEWEEPKFLKSVCDEPTTAIKIYPPFTNLKETVYKMKIDNAYGTHFMGAYYFNGTLYISDPNDRGVGVTVTSLKAGDNIEYLKEYI